jgi:repressor LexA
MYNIGEIGSRIKKLRKQAGLTQEALAQMLGKRKTTICNYETGYTPLSINTLTRLAQIFNTTAEAILGETSVGEPTGNRYSQVDFVSNKKNNDSLYVPEQLVGSGDLFIMQLEDDSLISSNLKKGDFILMSREEAPQNGDLAAVMIKGEKQVLRYYYCSEGKVTLLISEKTPPEVYAETEITVLGKAVKALVSLSK